MIRIDQLAYHNALSCYHVNQKVLFASIPLFCVVVTRDITISFFTFLFMSTFILSAAKIPLKQYLRLLLIPFGFSLAGTVPIILSFSTVPIAISPIWHYSAPFVQLFIVKADLFKALELFVVAFSSITCFYFLILTTPVMHVTSLLIRCRVPTIVIELFILIYRFIFLFLEHAEQIRTAQITRFGYQGYQSSFQSLALLMTGIFKQVFIRNTHLTEAMKARNIDCFVLPASVLNEPNKRHLFLSIGLAIYVIAATSIFLQELMK